MNASDMHERIRRDADSLFGVPQPDRSSLFLEMYFVHNANTALSGPSILRFYRDEGNSDLSAKPRSMGCSIKDASVRVSFVD